MTAIATMRRTNARERSRRNDESASVAGQDEKILSFPSTALFISAWVIFKVSAMAHLRKPSFDGKLLLLVFQHVSISVSKPRMAHQHVANRLCGGSIVLYLNV